MPTLYIIDGYAQFFRAYHAIRTPMTSPVTKEPTNMTFGFVGMLLKLLRGQGNIGGKPDYVAVALDVSGDRGTVRSQIYPEYKATRPEPPEDLGPQVDRCLAMLDAIGVPVIGKEEYEADDVIASMVAQLRAKHPDLTVRIISKDKDLKQVLSESVQLFDVHTDLAITIDTLKEETGLTPAQVVDMLTLMGDTVDNVPGVPGVGEKTAAKLVREYGSVGNLIARAGEVKGKLGENLRAAVDRLDLSRRLVTLHCDLELAPAATDLERMRSDALKLDQLLPILKELGFNRYQDEVRALMGVPVGAAPTNTPAARPAKAGGGGLFDHLDAPDGGEESAGTSGDYECVATRQQLDAVIEKLKAAPLIAIDTETTALSPLNAELCGISLSVEPKRAWYIPVRSPEAAAHLDEATVLAALRPVLQDETRPKCGHNLKYDMMVLRRAGVTLRGMFHRAGGCDSMVASYLIDSSRSSHSLDALSLALLGHGKQSISELIGSGKEQKSFITVPIDRATRYAAMDADLSLQLAQAMLPQLKAMGLDELFYALEMPLVEVLAELEYNGVLVDPDELDRQRERLSGRITALMREIQDRAMETIGRTFDPDSPKQLGAALFNRPTDTEPGLGIKPIKKTKTGYSTDAEVLEKLGSDPEITTPIPALILEYRQLTKLVSTYLVALKDAINPRTKRVHTSFNQTVAATGRLASSDPNLQNIPIRTDIGRDIRRAFVAPPGRLLVTADYSQIELRLLAHLSRDPALIEAFMKGEDIHTAVAAQIHGLPLEKVTKEQRSGAKMVNFGIVYGITAFGLARRLKIENDAAAAIIDGYKRRFAGITTFLQECIEQARRFGYVETMLKRRRPIPDIESNNPQMRSLAERVAINSVVQGSAADLIKLAMVDLYRRFRDHEDAAMRDVKMILQIHDELVFEAPAAVAERAQVLVVERMESAMTLSVPLKADAHVAANWFEGK